MEYHLLKRKITLAHKPKFTLSSILCVVAFAAVLLSWIVDHRSQRQKIDEISKQLNESLTNQNRADVLLGSYLNYFQVVDPSELDEVDYRFHISKLNDEYAKIKPDWNKLQEDGVESKN